MKKNLNFRFTCETNEIDEPVYVVIEPWISLF